MICKNCPRPVRYSEKYNQVFHDGPNPGDSWTVCDQDRWSEDYSGTYAEIRDEDKTPLSGSATPTRNS